MNAMERIKHYTNIKTEQPYDKSHAKQQAREEGGAEMTLLEPPVSWPDKGRVEFKNVCAKYRPELDRVLDGISFVVESRQKVGVVGRTGSGKSSMMLTLFRVLELEAGTITIDGIDASAQPACRCVSFPNNPDRLHAATDRAHRPQAAAAIDCNAAAGSYTLQWQHQAKFGPIRATFRPAAVVRSGSCTVEGSRRGIAKDARH
jgi:energy-coupling factor transporter ATP-binding protein EcfA2